MRERIKQYLIYALIIALAYFAMSYHFIYFGRSFKLLKKSELTLNYTFYSLENRTADKIMAVDDLRRDGIGELMLEMGLIDEKELEKLEEKFGD